MSTKDDLKVLTQEEVQEITSRLEKDEDFTSELARSLYTLIIISIEYHNALVVLQAYQQVVQDIMHDYVGAAVKEFGLRDTKKIQKLYKLAGKYTASIDSRISTYLDINDTIKNVEQTEETDNGNNNQVSE